MKRKSLIFRFLIIAFSTILKSINCWKIIFLIPNIIIYSLRQLRIIGISIPLRESMDYNDIPPAEMVNSSSSSEGDSEVDSESDDELEVRRRRQMHFIRRAKISFDSSLNKSHGSISSTTLPIDIYVFRPYTLVKLNYKLHRPTVDFPTPRSGHRVIATESNLYSLGGYNPRTALAAARRGLCLLFQELWCYNFATNKWKLHMNDRLGYMPRELASVALAMYNNVLISHGGTGYPFGESCSNDCYIYSIERPLVTKLIVEGDLPAGQYGPGIILHENYLYTIGGTTGFDYSCDVFRLNLLTKIWENVYICRSEMRDDPEGRYRHEVVYDGNYIYVLGGGTSTSVYDLQRIPAFNLKKDRWDYFETLPDPSIPNGHPSPRKCFSCVQHETPNGIEAFITGGLQCDFRTYFADIWKINFKSMQWTLIKTSVLPKPLYFHSAATSNNGCMYIFGGIEYRKSEIENQRRRNDIYKMWITIPKLSEICWDAITHYNPNLDRYNKNTLLQLGIPSKFVQRLPKQKLTKKNNSSTTSMLSGCPLLSKRIRCLSQ